LRFDRAAFNPIISSYYSGFDAAQGIMAACRMFRFHLVTFYAASPAQYRHLSVKLYSRRRFEPVLGFRKSRQIYRNGVWSVHEGPERMPSFGVTAKTDGLLGTAGLAEIPLPDSGTVSGLPNALLVKVSVATKLLPTAVGVNVTPALQVAFAARLVTFAQFESPLSVVLVVSIA
jgi:hypothetical protein